MKNQYLNILTNKVVIIVLVGISLIIIAISFGSYVHTFPGGFSSNHENWAQFGDFFGGILNPILSFLALLALILTLKMQIESKNETTFFTLINHHLDKINNLEVEDSDSEDENENKIKCKGYDCFKVFKKDFEKTLFSNLENNWVLSVKNKKYGELIDVEKKGIQESADELNPPAFFNEEGIEAGYNICNEDFKEKVLRKLILKMSSRTRDGIRKITFKRLNSDELQLAIIQTSYEDFYKFHGNTVGHYFRHMNSIFEHIYNNPEPEKYAKIFRSYFSRFQLVLLYYNCLSTYSGDPRNFLKFVITHEMLKGHYQDDFYFYEYFDILLNARKLQRLK